MSSSLSISNGFYFAIRKIIELFRKALNTHIIVIRPCVMLICSIFPYLNFISMNTDNIFTIA